LDSLPHASFYILKSRFILFTARLLSVCGFGPAQQAGCFISPFL
jgi:hypothetical protein